MSAPTDQCTEAQWAAARRMVIYAYARLDREGRPVCCRTTRGKVMYDTEADALDASAELIPLGARPCRAYRHGDHWHLATEPEAR